MFLKNKRHLIHFAIFLSLVLIQGCGEVIYNSEKGNDFCNGSTPASCYALNSSSASYPKIFTMSGCTRADYSITAQVGATSNFQLLVDSGSTDLAVASTGCTNCGSISPEYYYLNGKSLNTTLTDTYGSGSWTGTVYSDYVTLNGMPSILASFGAITSQDSFFLDNDCVLGSITSSQVQGIMGLAFSSLGAISGGGYLDDLSSQQSIPNKFSVQMCQNGGNFWLGGYDSSYTTATPQYTPIVEDEYYSVDLEDVAVGGTSLGLSASAYETPIVDTGTSLTLLPTAVYNDMVALIVDNSTFVTQFGSSFFSNGSCVFSSLTQAQLDADLPSLTLTFPATSGGTFTITLPPTRSYLDMHQDSSGNQYYCVGIAASPFSIAIIGGSFQRSLITVFDRANNQVGFASETGCAS